MLSLDVFVAAILSRLDVWVCSVHKVVRSLFDLRGNGAATRKVFWVGFDETQNLKTLDQWVLTKHKN
jgi:hypothetical protein